MNKTTFEVAKIIRQIIVNAAADGMNYLSWTPKMITKMLRGLPEEIRKNAFFSPIDPTDLTEKEMIEIGFRKWEEENPMYLIPLWLFPFLQEEINAECINGEKRIFKKSEMDIDTRFGLLAYGVIPKK